MLQEVETVFTTVPYKTCDMWVLKAEYKSFTSVSIRLQASRSFWECGTVVGIQKRHYFLQITALNKEREEEES